MGLLDSQSEINFKPFLSYEPKVTPFLSHINGVSLNLVAEQ